MSDKAAAIAALNDRLRTTFDKVAGQIIMTRGIADLPQEDRTAIFSLVQTFNDFTPDNDPYGEHDFGKVEHNGHEVFFKFDYYDESMQYHSDDPADPAKTNRVMTIMLANEY